MSGGADTPWGWDDDSGDSDGPLSGFDDSIVLSGSTYVTEEGTLRWKRLVETTVGAFILAVSSGFIQITQNVGDALSALLNAPATFAADIITLVFDAPRTAITTAWDQVSTSGGPFTFLMVVGLVLASGWILSQGVEYVREEVL